MQVLLVLRIFSIMRLCYALLLFAIPSIVLHEVISGLNRNKSQHLSLSFVIGFLARVYSYPSSPSLSSSSGLPVPRGLPDRHAGVWRSPTGRLSSYL